MLPKVGSSGLGRDAKSYFFAAFLLFLMKIPQKYCRIEEYAVFTVSLLLHTCIAQRVKILGGFHPNIFFQP